MFQLRCEMQAMSEYAEQNDQAGMNKSIKRLEKDDTKIADMVSDWEKDTKPRLLSEFDMLADKGDTYRVGKTLKMIQRTPTVNCSLPSRFVRSDRSHYNSKPLSVAGIQIASIAYSPFE